MEPTEPAGYASPAMSEQDWSEFIRASRKALGLTQAGLARKLSLLILQVSRWETGRQAPPAARQEQVRRQIARLLSRKPPTP